MYQHLILPGNSSAQIESICCKCKHVRISHWWGLKPCTFCDMASCETKNNEWSSRINFASRSFYRRNLISWHRFDVNQSLLPSLVLFIYRRGRKVYETNILSHLLLSVVEPARTRQESARDWNNLSFEINSNLFFSEFGAQFLFVFFFSFLRGQELLKIQKVVPQMSRGVADGRVPHYMEPTKVSRMRESCNREKYTNILLTFTSEKQTGSGTEVHAIKVGAFCSTVKWFLSELMWDVIVIVM